MEDQALLARDPLSFKPSLTFIEPLGKSIILKVLNLLDEVSVDTVAASPFQHPEEGPLCGGVEDVQGVGKVRVILWLHVIDSDRGSHLVRRHVELLEDIHFVLRLEHPSGRRSTFERGVRLSVTKVAE